MKLSDQDENTLPVEQLDAAFKFVEKAAESADGMHGFAPWWHGWAMRAAFHAGAAWARDPANSKVGDRS
jgi:hypothetical protein